MITEKDLTLLKLKHGNKISAALFTDLAVYSSAVTQTEQMQLLDQYWPAAEVELELHEEYLRAGLEFGRIILWQLHRSKTQDSADAK